MLKVSKIQKHFDNVAEDYDFYKKRNSFYYDNLKKLLKNLVPQNKKLLEVGCGTGDLLFYLKPKFGYGIDISSEMIGRANSKYGNIKRLTFSTKWPKKHRFDYIYMSDVVEHLDRPKIVFNLISKNMDKDTVFVCTMANPLWEPILMLWEKMGWKMPEGPHFRIKYKELITIMEKIGFKIVKHDYKLLIPIDIPFVTVFANNYLEKYLKPLCFIEYFVAVKS